MESAHHFSFRPDCNNTAEVPSFTLRTALSAIQFVSDLCGVDVQMISRKDLHRLCKLQGVVSVNDFRLPIRLPELLQAPFVSPEKFLFCTGTTESIGWQSPAPRLHIDDCFDTHNLH